MFGLGAQELIIVLAIVMILFGGKKLPELAGGMGKAIRNFKKATSEPDEIAVSPDRPKVEGSGGAGPA